MEIMIALAIVSILTVVAIQSYRGYVRRSRRIDAINSLLAISLAQERYRSNNSQYGTLAQVWGGVTASPEGYYTLAVSGNTASAYTVTATPTGPQVGDTVDGTSCSPLQLTVSSGTVTKSPAACWPK